MRLSGVRKLADGQAWHVEKVAFRIPGERVFKYNTLAVIRGTFMKAFVVRLNPDTRDCLPYSKYPTLQEYRNIHKSSPMNGFHEAVNFLSEDGVVRGYLPPRHLTSLRSPEPFALVTITAKTAKTGGNMVVGIQAACKYEGENTRVGGTRASRALALNWHYSCGESLSLAASTNARRPRLGSWQTRLLGTRTHHRNL